MNGLNRDMPSGTASLYRVLLLGLSLTWTAASAAHETFGPAVGWGALSYTLPAPGSYTLPPLGGASDGTVLDEQGQRRRLYDIYGRKVVLLGLIYSRCEDVNACPLSSYVFYRIKAAMQHDPALAKSLKLVTLSFDPAYDTPRVMRRYRANFKYAGPKGEWRFLTTASRTELTPILRAYHQPIEARSESISHILRVYLIDPERQIRNIYNVGFLHPDVLLADARTLLMEASRPADAMATAVHPRAADDRGSYASPDHTSRTRALTARRGRVVDLIAFAEHPPLGLPALPVPPNNPLTRAKIALGRRLFYERRLSHNNTISCAICHIPEQGFSNNELATAVGIEGRSVRRNSPTIYNAAYYRRLFVDGREESLEQQIFGPLLSANEMGNPSIGLVLEKIRQTPGYSASFAKAFPERGLDAITLGMAIASYQRTLISGDSPFDRWHYGQQTNALHARAKRGFELFTGKAHCVVCHRIGARYALFSDHRFHNTGIGYRASTRAAPAKQAVVLAPGVTVEVARATIDAVSEPAAADLGLYEITLNPADRWKYKTPILRNVALTAPYMHNGALPTPRAVIEFYNRGGAPNPLLDPLIKPLHLNPTEVDDLVAFLNSLTGSNVAQLVSDAFAAPVGDVTRDDPYAGFLHLNAGD